MDDKRTQRIKMHPVYKVNVLIMEHLFGQTVDENIQLQQVIPYASQTLYLEAIINEMYHKHKCRLWLINRPDFDNKFTYVVIFYDCVDNQTWKQDEREYESLMTAICLAALKALKVDFDYKAANDEYEAIISKKVQEEIAEELKQYKERNLINKGVDND